MTELSDSLEPQKAPQIICCVKIGIETVVVIKRKEVVAMSDSDSTQSWNDDDEDNGFPSSQAFDDALSILDEHLQEHDEPALYDEEQQKAETYEEGVEFASEIDDSGDPVDASYIDQAENSDLSDSHQPEVDDLAVSEAINEDEIIEEEILELDDEAEEDLNEEEILELDDETEEDLNEEDSFENAEQSDEIAEDSEEYEIAKYSELDSEPEAAAEESQHSMLGLGGNGNDGTDDFNLATLTQLVDEIRQESQRVAEMKVSVSEALTLIQEMSESLKS